MANILPLFAVFFSCGNILINVLEKSDNISKEEIVIDNSFYLSIMGLVISLLYKYIIIFDYLDMFLHWGISRKYINIFSIFEFLRRE